MRTMNARQGRAPALTSPKKKPSSKKYSDVSLVNEEKKEEERPESAVVVPPRSSLSSRKKKGKGTILEAAFVDPAYAWPPAEGQGKNAIELQATLELLKDQGGEDSDDETNTESHKPKSKRKLLVKLFSCCKSEQDVEEEDMELMREKAARYAAEEKEQKKKLKYNRVPEGILIYRLDTSDNTLTLLSKPHSKTNMSVVLRKMKIVQADAAPDKSRRGMLLTCGVTGRQMMLVACEQRTAIAWFEAISLMLAKKDKGSYFGMSLGRSANRWSEERLGEKDLQDIEGQYLGLANYSNKLIRAGALPGGKKGAGGVGGIYYSVQKVSNDPLQEPEEEALEAIAKRRAVIKDSWDFYRMICSLLRDRNKYDEVFRRMQLDPVYPYLNSMTGLNDPGDGGYKNNEKPLIQTDLPEYSKMSKTAVAQALVQQAEAALPSLVEICKALAGSLGMEEVGVGPVKLVSAALRKAEKKYDGDLLRVTDYCRALLVVKDFPTLLALLELARDSFGPLIRRVKMSTLKSSQKAKSGGYRDCIINLELKGHICEIQVHLWPMWTVCGVDGFRHYRHCVEYNTDEFEDPYDSLDGLDRKTVAELIVMAEEAVVYTPLSNLEWYHEKQILDYFSEAGLFLTHGLDVWAEIIFQHLIKLRTESPDIGPDHHETMNLRKCLAQALTSQGRKREADIELSRVEAFMKSVGKGEVEQSLWEGTVGAAYDMVVDPNRKVREAEEKFRQDVKVSKKQWRRIRQERFKFLDVDLQTGLEN